MNVRHSLLPMLHSRQVMSSPKNTMNADTVICRQAGRQAGGRKEAISKKQL